jgi:hypothetical protein
MNKFEIPYSLKNIPVPSKLQYQKQLISKVEKFVTNLRWKLFFITNPTNNESKKTFGFKSNNSVPQFNELDQIKGFEDDLLNLIANIKYKPVLDQFQRRLREDCKKIKDCKNVITPADKTANLYEIPVPDYKQLIRNQVTKDYKKSDSSKIDDTNLEAAELAKELEVADRIEVLATPSCFITVKDHKDTFPGRIDCRLINPAKTKMGNISKQILDKINNKVRSSTKSNHWRSTKDTLDWFKGLKNKNLLKFFQFDIESFYPSITESLLLKALDFASRFIEISDQDKKLIIHSRKTFLFLEEDAWVKKSGEDFDVPMGGYDSAEVSDLVGLYILNKIEAVIPQEHVGLYRDDGLAVVQGSGPQIDRIRKKIIQVFAKEGLKITVEANIKTTNFLDVNLNLDLDSFKPYRKPNDKPNYINVKSNHPPCIKRDLPGMVEKRLSDLSSHKELFDSEKSQYQEALKDSGYTETIQYKNNLINGQTNRSRTRNILWFNPPYNSSVSTNIGKDFLNLLDKHFPARSNLHKYFNRNTIKISYSCMPNIGSIISSHNKKVLGQTSNITEKGCNCKRGTTCPLDGKCLTKSLVYKAEVKVNNTSSNYFGLASTTFKTRYSNHTSNFRNANARKCTKLANFVWDLKDGGQAFTIDWSIQSLQPTFDPGSNKCQLCLMEKVVILNSDKRKLINKRHELFTKCLHRRTKLLATLV